MKFGNWMVTEDGIEWRGAGYDRFVVAGRQLLEKESNKYKWILRATNEDWLTDDDLYDFNFAFVYAATNFGDFDYEIFDRTLAEQYELLDNEEREQPDLSRMPKEEADKEQQRKDAFTGRD
jgi:hypothetical protein